MGALGHPARSPPGRLGTGLGAHRGPPVRLGTGLGDWPALVRALKKIDFQGPISFHSEYSGEVVDTVVDLCRIDVRFFENFWNATD